MKHIEINCEHCLTKNKMAERLIESLQRDLKLKEDQYEAFKYVARLEHQRRKGFFAWLFDL